MMTMNCSTMIACSGPIFACVLDTHAPRLDPNRLRSPDGADSNDVTGANVAVSVACSSAGRDTFDDDDDDDDDDDADVMLMLRVNRWSTS